MKMEVEIYIKKGCPYCDRALNLLGLAGVTPTVYDVMVPQREPRAREIANRIHRDRLTVPQIFVDGQGIGGCSELEAIMFGGAG